jgi:hypothetical protein
MSHYNNNNSNNEDNNSNHLWNHKKLPFQMNDDELEGVDNGSLVSPTHSGSNNLNSKSFLSTNSDGLCSNLSNIRPKVSFFYPFNI